MTHSKLNGWFCDSQADFLFKARFVHPTHSHTHTHMTLRFGVKEFRFCINSVDEEFQLRKISGIGPYTRLLDQLKVKWSEEEEKEERAIVPLIAFERKYVVWLISSPQQIVKRVQIFWHAQKPTTQYRDCTCFSFDSCSACSACSARYLKVSWSVIHTNVCHFLWVSQHHTQQIEALTNRIYIMM